MSEQEAFEQWRTNKYLAKEFGALTLQDAWQAALEWARSEQEPVACIGTNGELMWLKKPEVLYSKPIPLYRHLAPAVAQEPVLQRVMGRLADLLDEDQFAEIEGMVVRAGIAPPAVAVNEQLLEALKHVSKSTGFWYLDFDDRQDVSNAIAAAEAAKGGV